MIENYSKYKDRLKTYLYRSIVVNVCVVLFCFMFLFLPCLKFSIELGSNEEYSLSYSLFDTLLCSLKKSPLKERLSSNYLGYYMWILYIGIFIAMIQGISGIIKQIGQLQNPEMYAMFACEDMSKGKVAPRDMKAKKHTVGANTIIVYLVMFAFYVLMFSSMGVFDIMGEGYLESEITYLIFNIGEGEEWLLKNAFYANGVEFWLFLCVLVFIAMVIVKIYSETLYSQIKNEVMEQDYLEKKAKMAQAGSSSVSDNTINEEE